MPEVRKKSDRSRIDTSQLKAGDRAFICGYLMSAIETRGKATREDAENAIAAAIQSRGES